MITIDETLCIGCGICVETCPFDSITLVNNVPVVSDTCNLCGSCSHECPVGAIVITRPEMKAGVASEARDVWVWLEISDKQIKPVSLELLGIARELADTRKERVAGILIGDELEGLAEMAIAHGADKVWRISSQELKYYETGLYAAAVDELAKRYHPSVILFGATYNGRDLAPRVAARLRTGLTADCTGLAIEPSTGHLLQTRPAFGGNIMATILTPNHRPQLATVRPGVIKKPPADYSRAGEIIDWPCPEPRFRLSNILGFIPSNKPDVRLEEADIIVAGGRGVGGSKGLKLLEQLARVLGGQLAVSRGPVDEGWISSEYQVGQTGKIVAPRLYIACGISGTVQHLVGIQSASTIVAINKDARAPIFKVADYGLVGDLFEIVPRLINKLSNPEV
ncbi:MAG: electron transfer flavoprotein subunit alpha [Syntrophothermus sp.]|nr:electron transfer flavoprotein subunit alpha [Syntrophothermus sp.]